MQAKDLRAEPPRRWSVHVAGIPWIPRLIDKTRAALAGTLGTYLFGQSPMDRSCLRALGLSHREFALIVASANNDEDVLAAIHARNPEAIERGRVWGKRIVRSQRCFFFLLDVDDGYAGTFRPVKPLMNVISNSVTWIVKRVWPSRAAERADGYGRKQPGETEPACRAVGGPDG